MRNSGMLNKMLSALLAVALVIGLNPVRSWADEGADRAAGESGSESVQVEEGSDSGEPAFEGDAADAVDGLSTAALDDNEKAAEIAAGEQADRTVDSQEGLALLAAAASGSVSTQDAGEAAGKMSDVKPGRYTVSANLVVPGKYNTVLKGVDAYATNPDNPLGATDDDPNNGGEGIAATYKNAPTMGVENNATLEVSEDGTRTIVLNVPNPVFTIQGIDGCDNATAEVASTVSGTYGTKTSRINQIKFTLGEADLTKVTEKVRGDVSSGSSKVSNVEQTQAVYLFNDCKEFPTLLNMDWTVPLELRVDVAGCLDGSAREKTPVDKPTAKEGLYERFAYQSGVATGEGYTLSGTTRAWRAGTYTAMVTLSDGYVWSDGTSDPVSVAWTINVPTPIAKPTVTTVDVYYDGEEHGPVITQNGSTALEGLQITGTEKASDPGNYRVSIEPAYGYKWANLNSSYAYTAQVCDWSIQEVRVAVSVKSPLVVGIDDSQTVDLPLSYLKKCRDDGWDVMTDEEAAALGITSKGFAADRKLTSVSGLGFQLPENAVYAGGFDWELSDDMLPTVTGYNIYAGQIAGQVRAWYMPAYTPAPISNAVNETGSAISYQDAITGVDWSQYEVSGDLSATEPGTYRVQVKPVRNYRWAGTAAADLQTDVNAGTETRTVEWVVRGLVDAPQAVGGLVYDGTQQQGVASGAAYELSGATATDAGDYVATATLKDGFAWSDGTTAPKEIPWSIAKAELTATYVGETIAYGDEPALAVAFKGFAAGDSSETIVGFEKPTVQAPADLELGGSYELTPVGGNAGRNYAFAYRSGVLTVGPKGTVSVPGIAGNRVYNGAEQQFGLESGEHYAVSGITAATNAGTYEATLTLEPGYVWADGGVEPKTYKWSIGKAKLTAAYIGETVEVGAKPEGKVLVTGFVNGETPTTAAGYVAPAVEIPGVLEAGKSYELVPAGGEADNYEFAYNAGELTIKAKAAVDPDKPKADDAEKGDPSEKGDAGKTGDGTGKGDDAEKGGNAASGNAVGNSAAGQGGQSAAMAQTGDLAGMVGVGALTVAVVAAAVLVIARRRSLK